MKCGPIVGLYAWAGSNCSRCLAAWRLDAVGADETGRVGGARWQSWRGHGLALRFLVRQFEVQAEEEGERIFVGVHAVGGADGGVEGGVGVA